VWPSSLLAEHGRAAEVLPPARSPKAERATTRLGVRDLGRSTRPPNLTGGATRVEPRGQA
jgi:hypothetical protein